MATDVSDNVPLADGRQRQLQRDRLARLLRELEQEAGPIEPRVMEEVRRSWRAPAGTEPRG